MRADACIVGAGIAGLVLASRLRAHGLRVAIVESGPAEPQAEPDPLNRVVERGDAYPGAMDGRSRGLGGTSARWGGQLVPLRPEAFVARPHLGLGAWPVAPEALAQHLPGIEKLFGTDDGAYDASFIKACKAEGLLPAADPDIQPSFSKAPAFRRRNVATLLADLVHNDPAAEVLLNATITAFEVDRERGRIKSATARGTHGHAVRIEADFFILAAGAIEATRLLQALDAAQDGRVFADCPALGRYFHDHISLLAAEFLPVDRRRFNRAFGHRFVGTTMRNTRLELTSAAQAADSVACAYGHVAMEMAEGSPFHALRDFLLSRQKSGTAFDTKLLIALLKQFPYLASVGWWRFAHNQLHWSKDAELQLHMVAEQVPHPDNRVSLSDEHDAFGIRVAAIDWRRRDTEMRTFASYARRFDAFWRRQNMDRLARLKWIFDPSTAGAGTSGSVSGAGDVYHPAGSTRMGTNGNDAVVDSNLRTFAIENLWVASTSVFPSLTSANPTLTLMLLCLRLGDHIATLKR